MKRDYSQLTPSDIAISVKNLGKKYHLYDRPKDRLREALHPFRRKYHREFWALKDVSFEVTKGECFGIIGKNGSGKSTLLKIIAGVLTPTEGDLYVRGSVSALLELGAGFNPEYTGIQNVCFHASIHDWAEQDRAARIDAITSFADIGEFIEYPVKTYSTGMFLRLAFACAIYDEADMLVIDEALAVGDVYFRQKCHEKLRELTERGVAIILVSHSMPEVQQFCQRVLLLDHGKMRFYGDSSEGIKTYYLLLQDEVSGRKTDMPETPTPDAGCSKEEDRDQSSRFWPGPDAFLPLNTARHISNGWAECTGIAVCDRRGMPCTAFIQGETAVFFYEFRLLHYVEVPVGGIMLRTDKGVNLHGKTTLQYEAKVLASAERGETIRFRQEIQLTIASGEYTFDIGLTTLSRDDYASLDLMPYHELMNDKGIRVCHIANAGQLSVLGLKRSIPGDVLHHGLANLPGNGEVWRAAGSRVSETTGDGSVPRRPRVVINSIPKAGTHLLKKCLTLFPGFFLADLHVDRSVRREDLYERLRAVPPGGVVTAHLPYEDCLGEMFRDLNYAVFFMIRDPRDRAVSHAKYVAGSEGHFLHSYYEPLSEDQRLTCSIGGLSAECGVSLLNIDAFYRIFLGWRETAGTCTIRFENLIGNKGEGSTSLQFQEVRTIARHLHLVLSEEELREIAGHIFDPRSITFRKGQIGDWRNHFNSEHIQLFKRIAGRLLIDLGYEQDTSW